MPYHQDKTVTEVTWVQSPPVVPHPLVLEWVPLTDRQNRGD